MGINSIKAWTVLWRHPTVLGTLAASCMLLSMGQGFLCKLQVGAGETSISMLRREGLRERLSRKQVLSYFFADFCLIF